MDGWREVRGHWDWKKKKKKRKKKANPQISFYRNSGADSGAGSPLYDRGLFQETFAIDAIKEGHIVPDAIDGLGDEKEELRIPACLARLTQ